MSYRELVERFKIPAERNRAMAELSGCTTGREARGKQLEPEKIDALIWGLRHENAAVRRCCLELLDAHSTEDAVPAIIGALSDPVARVRWHAVHALECEVCKAGQSFLTEEAIAALRPLAASDPSPKVRSYAARILRAEGAA